jgi:hypothetical protein
MNDDELRVLLIEHMGKGFLENIIAMMKQDRSMVRFLPDMLGDEAIAVRLGATALVEELVKDHRHVLAGAVPGVIALLAHESPTVRGDAANVLGIIGDRSARESIVRLLEDRTAAVREIAREALEEIDAEDAR